MRIVSKVMSVSLVKLSVVAAVAMIAAFAAILWWPADEEPLTPARIAGGDATAGDFTCSDENRSADFPNDLLPENAIAVRICDVVIFEGADEGDLFAGTVVDELTRLVNESETESGGQPTSGCELAELAHATLLFQYTDASLRAVRVSMNDCGGFDLGFDPSRADAFHRGTEADAERAFDLLARDGGV